MAKLNLDTFKSNANEAVARQETQGIFKDHHDVHESVSIDALIAPTSIRLFEKDLSALSHSIELLGQIEPIIVRAVGDQYEVLNGNRRVAIAKSLGFLDISVDIIEASDSDALFLPYLLNSHEGFDIIEIAYYLQGLKEKHKLSNEMILEKTGLHVSKYSDLFSDTQGVTLQSFNDHYNALLNKYFKLRNGAFDIEKNGINLKIGIDTKKADEESKAEIYRFIHKLSNL
jgi:hypothetical protein